MTDQTEVHQDLMGIVHKHMTMPYQRPIPEAQQALFQRFLAYYKQVDKPLILDSGCGRGLSTQRLAEKHPDCWVLGVDKSLDRLSHQHTLEEGAYLTPAYGLLRAELIDFWRLLLAAQLPIQKHYCLYPNPWPKAKHLKRRFHAHPIFPTMLALAPALELRSNWKLYVDEFLMASQQSGRVEAFLPSEPLTHFEGKYVRAEMSVYRLLLDRPVPAYEPGSF